MVAYEMVAYKKSVYCKSMRVKLHVLIYFIPCGISHPGVISGAISNGVSQSRGYCVILKYESSVRDIEGEYKES